MTFEKFQQDNGKTVVLTADLGSVTHGGGGGGGSGGGGGELITTDLVSAGRGRGGGVLFPDESLFKARKGGERGGKIDPWH